MPKTISMTEFVENTINYIQQPQNISREVKNLIKDGYYNFREIYSRIKNDIDGIISYEIIPYSRLQNIETINNPTKFLLFLENKQPSQIAKYYKFLCYECQAIIDVYIKVYLKCIERYTENKIKKSLLPSPLNKMRNYDYYDGFKPIIYDMNYHNDVWFDDGWMEENIKDKTPKDCISLKKKLKKEFEYHNKVITKLKNEREDYEFNNYIVDNDYIKILEEMNENIEHFEDEISTYNDKLIIIDKYIEYIKEN
jgi:hypothetical protein